MAIIHKTTMSPGKLELLAGWLPAQPWYRGTGGAPALARAGGFRLDDPEGEVGIEFAVVADTAAGDAVAYHVPMTYRAAALPGPGASLIGTAEHGVLGRRWVYDGTCDPVLAERLVALIQGEAQPQAQSVSDTPDPTVSGVPVTGGSLTVTGPAAVASGPAVTSLDIPVAGDGAESGRLLVHLSRTLPPAGGASEPGGQAQPCLFATWTLPDGTAARGVFATARYTPSPAARS
jgi:maltokinase-like protein